MCPCYHSVQTLTLRMFERSRRVLVIFVWQNRIFFIYIGEDQRMERVVEHLYMVRDQSRKHMYICLHVNG